VTKAGLQGCTNAYLAGNPLHRSPDVALHSLGPQLTASLLILTGRSEFARPPLGVGHLVVVPVVTSNLDPK
jgi:hypothetical protein